MRLSDAMMAPRGRVAAIVLPTVVACVISACGATVPASQAGQSAPVPSLPATRASLSASADDLTGRDLAAALSVAAQASPAHFQFVKTIEIGGRRSTTETIDGVIDLTASRGRSTVQHFPGTALVSTSEVELDGNRLFVGKPNPTASGVLWELAYGGPADFLGLDSSGPNAIATLESMFSSPGRWRAIASDPSDAQGSRRVQLEPPLTDGTAISVVLDAGGRLMTIAAVSPVSGSSAGSESRVLTFVEFGVQLTFELPS